MYWRLGLVAAAWQSCSSSAERGLVPFSELVSLRGSGLSSYFLFALRGSVLLCVACSGLTPTWRPAVDFDLRARFGVLLG